MRERDNKGRFTKYKIIIPEKIRCICGCGKYRDKYDNKGRERRFIAGHNNSLKKLKKFSCIKCNSVIYGKCSKKKYCLECKKELIKNRTMDYYYKNKEKIREKINRRSKVYRENNKEKVNLMIKAWKLNNKDKRSKQERDRRKTDVSYRIISSLRTRLRTVLKLYTKFGKTMPSKKYGIDYPTIIEYLKPFPESISKYHIDHIKPLCSFDLTNPEEVRKAFAPENHQWLLAEENLKKGGRF